MFRFRSNKPVSASSSRYCTLCRSILPTLISFIITEHVALCLCRFTLLKAMCSPFLHFPTSHSTRSDVHYTNLQQVFFNYKACNAFFANGAVANYIFSFESPCIYLFSHITRRRELNQKNIDEIKKKNITFFK